MRFMLFLKLCRDQESFQSKQNTYMDSEISSCDKEDDGVLNSKHKLLRLPKKCFNGECSGVHHASIVPRKMRSVMKKQKSQSLSPTLTDSKNQNQLTCGRSKRCKKESTRKLKANQGQGNLSWSRKQILPRPITKDEEEVAETLYTLAWMLSSDDSTCEEHVESSIDKLSTMPKATKDSEAVLPNTSLERAFKEHNSQQKPGPIDRRHFNNEVEDLVSEVNIPTKSLWPKGGCSDDKLSNNTSNPSIPSNLSFDSRLNQLKHSDNSSQNGSYTKKVTVTENQLLEQQTIMGQEDDGAVPWLGLSTTGSSSFKDPLQQSATKCPARFNSSLFPARSRLLRTSFSTGKISKAAFQMMSKRRCAMHVYISHLIELLQTTERKDRSPLSQDHLRMNGFNGSTSTINIRDSNTERDCSADRSDIAKRSQQNQDSQDTSINSWFYSQKQNFDFLSLSMASGGVKPHVWVSGHEEGRGNILDTDSKVNLPRQHALFPLSMSWIQYPFAYGDHVSAGTMQQLFPHFGALGSEPPNLRCDGSGISKTE